MNIKLIKKNPEASGITSFYWDPEEKLDFLPGQYIYYTLDHLDFPDKRGATRHFTISNSPTEGKTLRLTTKIRKESGFKQTLDRLKPGDIVQIEGPTGTFVLDEQEKGPHVFLAGGIGITPFYSMMKYARDKKVPEQIFLIYSATTPEELAFKKEIENIIEESPYIQAVFTVTKPELSKSKWEGLIGRIDQKMIKSQLKAWGLKKNEPTFWVCGPPPMVSAMEESLGKMGIDENKIRSEKFSGY